MNGMRSTLRALGLMLAAPLGVACLGSPQLRSQPVPNIIAHPEWFEEVQDGFYVSRVSKSGAWSNPEAKIGAAYRFEMVYDSTSRVQYLFTECYHNGTRPRLLSWKPRHLHTAPVEQMTDSSRTENFKIAPGDTISFFRELKWYNPMTGRQDTNNFWSPDTLGYAVELVRATSGQRIALLDSFGVLAQLSPGAPTFCGSRPLIAHVTYMVPSTIPTSDSVFVRVRLYADGDGLFTPMRNDEWTSGMAHALRKGIWDYYLSLYGGPLYKQVTDELGNVPAGSGSLLSISNVSRETIRIRFSPPRGSGPVQVAIYDANGTPVFFPFATRGDVEDGTAEYTFDRSGVYIVALERSGAILSAKKITITL